MERWSTCFGRFRTFGRVRLLIADAIPLRLRIFPLNPNDSEGDLAQNCAIVRVRSFFDITFNTNENTKNELFPLLN